MGMGGAASPSQAPAGWADARGWGVEQGSCFQGSSRNSLDPETQLGWQGPFVSYHLPLRARPAGPTLGVNHLTPTLPKCKLSPQRQKTEAETAGLRVFISMPKLAQTWQTAAPEGKEGRQWQTKPGCVPGAQPGPGQQELQSRSGKGVGQGGKSWRHQGLCPGQEEQREREREAERTAGRPALATTAR